jgi:hypothetical protein
MAAGNGTHPRGEKQKSRLRMRVGGFLLAGPAEAEPARND